MKKLLLLLSISFCSVANAQWTPQATGFSTASRGLDEIKIVDANTVWAKAYDGSGAGGGEVQEFTRTANGGTNWTAGIINVGDPELNINNISPVSATTAWVSAVHPVTGLGSAIFKTSDGGVTWDQQNSTAFTSPTSFLNFVHFFDANIGFAEGDPVSGEFEIWRTIDGGDSWTLVPAANIPNPLSGEYCYNLGNIVIGSTAWLPGNKGRILKTNDMGLTWTAHQAPLTDFGSAAQSGLLSFSNASIGCLLKTVGTTYTLYTTTDGGVTWSAGAPFTGTRRILKYIPGTTTIVATSQVVGFSGTSISIDNGATWINVESDEQRGASAFLNATTGWCAGFSTNIVTDGVFKLTGPLGNASFENTSKFIVYPNPANNIITIASSGIESYKLSVADLTGKVLIEKSLNGIENTLDISSLSNGVYFFTLNSGDKIETVKIIKN